MSRKLLGIDIRKDAVSAIMIKGGIKGFVIDASFYMPLSAGEAGSESLMAALEKLTMEMDLTDTVCVASFPVENISYRNLLVPFKEARKIRQILPFEIEPTLPRPVDEMIVDFQVIKSSEQNHLLAAAVERVRVESYLEILSQYQIEPALVTAGALPTVLGLIQLADLPENLLVIDNSGANYNLFIVANNEIHVVRAVPKASEQEQDMRSLMLNIQRTVGGYEDFFQKTFQPDNVVLTGNGLDPATVSEKINRFFDCPVVTTNLMTATDLLDPPEEGIMADQNSYQNAAALTFLELEGIDCINFHHRRTAWKRQLSEYKHRIITTGILLAVLLVVSLGTVFFDIYSMNREIDSLKSKQNEIFKTAFPNVGRIVDPVQQMRNNIDELTKDLSGSDQGEPIPRIIDILQKISSELPKEIDTEFTRFVLGKDNIMISGDTANFNAVDDMKNRLEKVEWFSSVTISSANMEKSGKQVQFKLKIQF